MKKRLILTSIVALMAFSILPTKVLALGPTGAGGDDPLPIPYNLPEAAFNAGQYIGPSIFLIGTPTIMQEDGCTITVDEIPDATCTQWDPFDKNSCSGTWLMWKEMSNSKVWRSLYKFWLNGSGPVEILYECDGEPPVIEQAWEFLFFRTWFEDSEWVITLDAYK
jgi:hypothetical protein